MKYGARNQLKGEVVDVRSGDVMCQVKVRIPAESILSSVMTTESLAELDLKKGDQVTVVAKAVNVLLVRE